MAYGPGRHTARWTLRTIGAVALLGWVGAVPGSAADGSGSLFLQGQVSVQDDGQIGADDRLIIKTYHPGSDGIEKDPKYTFRQASELPLSFRVAPPIDMNGNARWPTFIVEAFTDIDGDVLTLSAGELFATTGEPLPLGTEGIALELKPAE